MAKAKPTDAKGSGPRLSTSVPPIFRAIVQNDEAAVAEILRTDPGQARTPFRYDAGYTGETPLHAAAQHGLPAVAELLLRHGADVNAARGDSGETPLHVAANNGQVEMVELLLRRGANIEAETLDHHKALHFCTPGRDPRCAEVANVLLRHGARVDLHGAFGLLDADRARQLLRDNPDAVATDPLADRLIDGAVAMMARKIDERVWQPGAAANQEQAKKWVSISREVVTADLDILENLMASKVPAQSRVSFSLTTAMEIADVRVVRKLLEYGVRPPSLRSGLLLSLRSRLAQNPCRKELTDLFRQHGIDMEQLPDPEQVKKELLSQVVRDFGYSKSSDPQRDAELRKAIIGRWVRIDSDLITLHFREDGSVTGTGLLAASPEIGGEEQAKVPFAGRWEINDGRLRISNPAPHLGAVVERLHMPDKDTLQLFDLPERIEQGFVYRRK